MPDRFYHPPPLAIGPVTLDGPEAHHLIHVLRAKPGLDVTLFDGSGAEFRARVEALQRTAVQLTALARDEVDRELETFVTIAVSLPKGERQRWLVEKATELGASRLVPLITQRSVAQPTAEAMGRLRRSVIEACKQCGRNRLMEIADPVNWAALIASPREAPAALRLVAHPGGRPLSQLPSHAAEIFFAVGPEGGFTDDEIQLAIDSGWRIVGLGPRILRIETAAFALLAAIALRQSSD